MNFKGLIIFDLALLRLTELPVIAHDSNIFKNIADLPIDKIMELYNQSERQIFIAFDKEDTFYDVTRDIVHSTKIKSSQMKQVCRCHKKKSSRLISHLR